jgi:predicted ABC-type ATPase
MGNQEIGGPRAILVGGPNGAGKTTCAATLLPEDIDLRQFVNADVIASGLSAFAPETVAVQAGRVMLARIADLARQHQDFAFETTLASRTFIPFLGRLQRQGYTIHVIFIWLESPELAVARVAARVRRGGHPVPAGVVRRRYWRGLANFRDLYRPLADSWVLCDNSGDRPVVVARGERHVAKDILDQVRYERIERALSGG